MSEARMASDDQLERLEAKVDSLGKWQHAHEAKLNELLALLRPKTPEGVGSSWIYPVPEGNVRWYGGPVDANGNAPNAYVDVPLPPVHDPNGGRR